MTTSSKGRHTEHDEPHWIEWATGIVSAILVIALVGWILMEALTRKAEQPDLSVVETGRTSGPSAHSIAFEVRNAATTTAAAVVIRGEIREGGETVEEVDVTFDYVPAESVARGAVIFSSDPAGREVVLRPVGFADP